jgi:hypothetical protein
MPLLDCSSFQTAISSLAQLLDLSESELHKRLAELPDRLLKRKLGSAPYDEVVWDEVARGVVP